MRAIYKNSKNSLKFSILRFKVVQGYWCRWPWKARPK